jgi:DNA gyrase/topoisomerase IV subunit B
MTTIEVRPGANVSVDEILNGISHLNKEELDRFVDKVLALRAKRLAPSLSRDETILLKKINRGLPVAKRKRLAFLSSKQSEGQISEQEYEELLSIIEELELLNAERVQYLGELSQLKGMPVKELMQELGIYRNIKAQ